MPLIELSQTETNVESLREELEAWLADSELLTDPDIVTHAEFVHPELQSAEISTHEPAECPNCGHDVFSVMETRESLYETNNGHWDFVSYGDAPPEQLNIMCNLCTEVLWQAAVDSIMGGPA